MIKRTIEITKEEAQQFLKDAHRVSMQMREGVMEAWNDILSTYFDMFGSEDEADQNEDYPDVPHECYYVLQYLQEAVGIAFVEDEIGCFFVICCKDPAYFGHVVKIANYMASKHYVNWIPNEDKIRQYLKNEYSL